MTNDRFEKLVQEIRDQSLNTLVQKNARYADEDRLHNFKVGAAITGGTPAQAALGYMAKHLASLQDKVRRNDFHDRDDLLEKCQDIINYITFIWCCGNEENEMAAPKPRRQEPPTEKEMPPMRKKLEKIVSHYDPACQMGKAQEECAELIQAISKILQIGDRVTEQMWGHLAEEMADVQIMLTQLRMYFPGVAGREDLWIEKKVNRQIERIKEENNAHAKPVE